MAEPEEPLLRLAEPPPPAAPPAIGRAAPGGAVRLSGEPREDDDDEEEEEEEEGAEGDGEEEPLLRPSWGREPRRAAGRCRHPAGLRDLPGVCPALCPDPASQRERDGGQSPETGGLGYETEKHRHGCCAG